MYEQWICDTGRKRTNSEMPLDKSHLTGLGRRDDDANDFNVVFEPFKLSIKSSETRPQADTGSMQLLTLSTFVVTRKDSGVVQA